MSERSLICPCCHRSLTLRESGVLEKDDFEDMTSEEIARFQDEIRPQLERVRERIKTMNLKTTLEPA